MTNNASGYCYLHVDQVGGQQQQKTNTQNTKPASKPNQAYSSPSNSNYSVADEIRKLKKLLDEGIITQEEFENQKKKLLEQ
jgi:hypothetical protein